MGDVGALVMFYDGCGDAESVCVAVKWTGLGVIKTFRYYVGAVRACKCIRNGQPAALVHLGVFFWRAAADALHGAGGSSGSSRQIQAPADLHLNSKAIDQLSAPVASLSPQDHTQRIHMGCRALNHTQGGFPAWKAATMKGKVFGYDCYAVELSSLRENII